MALLVIIIAFLLLGGGPWIKGIMDGDSSVKMNQVNMSQWNWTQILVSLGLGFILGLIVGKRRW